MGGRIRRGDQWNKRGSWGKVGKQMIADIDFTSASYKVDGAAYAGADLFGNGGLGGVAYDASKVTIAGLAGMGSNFGIIGPLLNKLLAGCTGVMEFSKSSNPGVAVQPMFIYIADNAASVVHWSASGNSAGGIEVESRRYSPPPTAVYLKNTGPAQKGINKLAFTFKPGSFYGHSLNGAPGEQIEPFPALATEFTAALIRSNNASAAIRRLTLYRPTQDLDVLQRLSRL